MAYLYDLVQEWLPTIAEAAAVILRHYLTGLRCSLRLVVTARRTSCCALSWSWLRISTMADYRIKSGDTRRSSCMDFNASMLPASSMCERG
jgi:hypothetical protein